MAAQPISSLPGQKTDDALRSFARQGQTPDPTTGESISNRTASGRDQFPQQAIVDAISRVAPPAGEQTTDRGQSPHDAQRWDAAVGLDPDPDQPVKLGSLSKVFALADPSLAFAADILDDLERTRNANANRLRVMTTTGVDKDGIHRGFGFPASHPDVARLSAMVAKLDELVHDATLNLQRQMRRHPLGLWVKAQRGIGHKQAARLLAAIGDPYWNTLHDRPRTVSELWAYCGLHTLPAGQSSSGTQPVPAGGDPTSAGDDQIRLGIQLMPVAARRTKGRKSNWSTNAKTRAWLCIESCMKQIDRECKSDTGIGSHVEGCKCSPYRVTIDKRRIHTAITHSEWTSGHSLNDAMRIASKTLLRDLWIEARDIHKGEMS